MLLPPCYSEIISLLGISYGNRFSGRDSIRSTFWGSNVDPGTYSVKSSSPMFFFLLTTVAVHANVSSFVTGVFWIHKRQQSNSFSRASPVPKAKEKLQSS